MVNRLALLSLVTDLLLCGATPAADSALDAIARQKLQSFETQTKALIEKIDKEAWDEEEERQKRKKIYDSDPSSSIATSTATVEYQEFVEILSKVVYELK